jgi:hypothetical protein
MPQCGWHIARAERCRMCGSRRPLPCIPLHHRTLGRRRARSEFSAAMMSVCGPSVARNSAHLPAAVRRLYARVDPRKRPLDATSVGEKRRARNGAPQQVALCDSDAMTECIASSVAWMYRVHTLKGHHCERPIIQWYWYSSPAARDCTKKCGPRSCRRRRAFLSDVRLGRCKNG